MTEVLHGADVAKTRQNGSENIVASRVHFKNPPINELVIGVYIDPPLYDLRNEHVGLFWQRIRDKFPVVEQHPPTIPLGFIPPADNELSPLPRYFFVTESGNVLLQVQKASFFLNWRKRDSEYPHFHENLKPAFDEYHSIFSDFAFREVGANATRIRACELTYVNLIGRSKFWKGPQDTSKIFPFLRLPNFTSDDNILSAAEYSFFHQFDSETTVKTTIKDVLKSSDPREPMLLFEFKATSAHAIFSKDHADSWFEKAHNILLYCFTNSTCSEIQKQHWIPEE